MNRKKLLISLAMAMLSMAGLAADNLPALRVQGKNLVDANGKTVVLHGVMDTPNRYFNGWRWQQWKADYSEADIKPCLEYFSKLFSAITDKKQGAYCTVFRLHMDPCWTNDPSKKAENEADISAFNMARYRLYLQKLYIPLIKDAIAHGLYVIVRPPGVCPGDISVDHQYNRYLKAIWKAFAVDEYIKQNSGIISIELANEPVRVHLSDGSNSDKALHDFFQPVVDVIREQGFNGIIWVPGTTWQQNYRDYVKHPIVDSQNNLGYAVHCYPGWYRSGSGNNDNTNKEIFYNAFLDAVPVAKTNPIIVTEIDWSPYKPGSGHKDEQGNWVESNYGTWGTATTSGFGEGWKYIHDKLGNISMTLQGSGLYFDIDTYLKDKVVEPAFKGVDEACGEACFKWYKEWYLKQNTTGIKQLETQADVVFTLYYNIEGKEVEKPTAGVYIIKQLLSNGKIRSRKVFLK
ncbi:cellulase family glycosylhydrolase [Segatella copri]|uniref:cellulase family glycosylhydrolase n=1 Tax=Segatella copri TaxID=165179 RepID=UPI003F707D16